ncbi:MAG: hypothetical protein H8E72_04160 [Candidatus Marinimicrobia bacterium]|nr:hypothetical protein [Candidatus Neomarinimicrobiota bacterium]
MFRLLTFILFVWIINKFFRTLFSLSQHSRDNSPEKSPPKSRRNMDIQDAEFEDVE